MTVLGRLVRGEGAKDDLQASSFWYWMAVGTVHEDQRPWTRAVHGVGFVHFLQSTSQPIRDDHDVFCLQWSKLGVERSHR